MAPGLCSQTLHRWLLSSRSIKPMAYPNVARCLADWLAGGCADSPAQLCRRLWLPGLLGAGKQAASNQCNRHTLEGAITR